MKKAEKTKGRILLPPKNGNIKNFVNKIIVCFEKHFVEKNVAGEEDNQLQPRENDEKTKYERSIS